VLVVQAVDAAVTGTHPARLGQKLETAAAQRELLDAEGDVGRLARHAGMVAGGRREGIGTKPHTRLRHLCTATRKGLV
jgi:hypothetical protein